MLAILLLVGLHAGGVEGPALDVQQPPVDFVCDYGENDPRLPTAESRRRELQDLLLDQTLRAPHRQQIIAALRERYPGEATEAFISILLAEPYDSDASVQRFEEIVRRYGDAPHPELQLVVARARHMLALAWRSRHVGAGEQGEYLIVAETYRDTEAGRRWSTLLDQLLRDYRGRGPEFDEFAAWAQYWTIIRDAADRQPERLYHDSRYLEPELAEIGRDFRARMQQLIDRYRESPSDRVQLTVARAMDAFARYDLGPAALIPLDREIIRRYRDARNVELRAEVGGSYHRLVASLREVDPPQAAAVEAEHRAWEAAHLDLDCGPA